MRKTSPLIHSFSFCVSGSFFWLHTCSALPTALETGANSNLQLQVLSHVKKITVQRHDRNRVAWQTKGQRKKD